MSDPVAVANLAAERGLLGLVLLRNDLIFEVSELQKVDFAESYNGELWILLKDLITSGKSISAITILPDAQDAVIWGELKASEYLARLENDAPLTDQATKAKEFAVAIRDAGLNRRVVSTLDQLRERIIASPVSIPGVKLRDEVDSAVTALFSNSLELGLRDIADVGDSILDRLRSTTVEIGRNLGLSFIQNLTGPLLPGRLYLFAGSPGAGKSSLLAQIARYDATQGGHPLLFTMEMRSEEVVSRLLASAAGVKAEQIERNLLRADEFERLFDANEANRNLLFKVTQASKFSVAYLRARAQRQKKLQGLSLVEVDHAHYLAKPDRRMSDHEALTENLEGLKGAAMELEVPVVAACHLSTEGLKDLSKWPHRLPTSNDILYSGAIDRNADVVLIMHRLEHMLKKNRPRKEVEPERFAEWETEKMRVAGWVHAILCKRRGGIGEGEAVGYYDAPRFLFGDHPFREKNYDTPEQRDLMSMTP